MGSLAAMARKENDLCVEACSDDRYDRASDDSSECALRYRDLITCYAGWTCDEWREFKGLETQKCGLEYQTFDDDCPDIAKDP